VLAAPPGAPSRPVCAGCVQVTSGGQPILLLRDHPTVGGYTVAAVVIEADLDLAGQLRPGALVRFTEVTEAEAIAAL
jgi:allophanate hydrolase subunit 2